MKTYTLQRIGVFSLFKFGALIGMIVAFLPITLGYTLIWWIVVQVTHWLQELVYVFSVPLFGDVTVDGVELLNLGDFLAFLETLAAIGWFGVLLAVILSTLLSGVFAGILAALSGVVFNLVAQLSGGLEVTLSERQIQPEAVVALPERGKPSISGDQPRSGPRLELVSPSQQIFPAVGRVTSIGSNTDCTIRLTGLAPHHAKIVFENGRYILYDQNAGQT